MTRINNERKNFIWNFLGLTINSFNSFFFLVIVNRINGSYDAGIFTYAWSLICLFFYIGLYFSRAYQVNNVDEFGDREFIVSRKYSSLLMLIITIIYCIVCRYDLYKMLVIILICAFRLLEAFVDSYYGILQKNNELYKVGFSQFVKGIIGLLLFVLIDIFTNNVLYSIIGVIAINIIMMFFYDFRISKKYIDRKKYNNKNIIKIFKITLPIFLFSFLYLYMINISKYMLDFYDSEEMQNIFGIILMPGTILSLCSSYLINPYLLNLSKLYENKQLKKFNSIVLKICVPVVLIGIIGIIVVYTFGINILNFIYSIDLFDYKNDLALIIIGAIFMSISSILSNVLTIMNRNKSQVVIYLVVGVIGTILSLLLVNSYKIIGASISYLIIMLLVTILFIIYYTKCLWGEFK